MREKIIYLYFFFNFMIQFKLWKTHIHWNKGVFLCRNIYLFPREIFNLFVRGFSTKYIKCRLWKCFIYSRRNVSVDVRRFYNITNKCRYLHEINEKSRTGIKGYFYIKNPLLKYYDNGISKNAPFQSTFICDFIVESLTG